MDWSAEMEELTSVDEPAGAVLENDGNVEGTTAVEEVTDAGA